MAEQGKFLKAYIAIRKFFQPDYNYISKKDKKAKNNDYSDYVGVQHDLSKIKLEKPLSASDVDNDEDKKKNSEPVALASKQDKTSQSKDSNQQNKEDGPRFRTYWKEHNNDEPRKSLTGEKLTMNVVSVPKPLDNPLSFKTKPKINTIWTYHDESRHQAFAHLLPASRSMNKVRDNERRSQLKPWLRPRSKKEHHRTHMIPFGYHGSENDPRLVVLWSKEHNSNQLYHFENKISALKKAVYWHCDIRRTKNGAAWRYVIYDAKTEEKIDQLIVKMDHTPFQWEK